MRTSRITGLLLAAALSAAAALMLTNCSGTGGNASVVAPHSSPAGPNLYVTNFDAASPAPQSWDQFLPPFSESSTPLFAIGLSGQVGIASNATYVAVTSETSDSIAIYSQPVTGASVPALNLANTGTGSIATFDASGDLWVSTYLPSSVQEVNEFTPPFTNAQAPNLTVTTDIFDPLGIAFDASANMYVIDSNSAPPQLLVYAPPYTGTPTDLNLPLGTPAFAVGVAVFGTQLAVGVEAQSAGARPHVGSIIRHLTSEWLPGRNHSSGVRRQEPPVGGELLTYALPITVSSTPTATITQTGAEDVAFDASGTLYVGDFDVPGATGGVLVFDQPLSNASTYAFAITTGIDSPAGLNFGP
jgi:hypothetical protein